MREIVWFSCGATSAVSAKLACAKYKNPIIIYLDTGGEHPDNMRFLRDCENWIGKKIQIIKNENYEDHFDVFEKVKYLTSPLGAPCTKLLKRKMREDYQRPNDLHIFGFSVEERLRALKFEMRNKGLKVEWNLINEELTKQNCLGILWKAGIKIPAMYDLGYDHNNCIGCVKGGKGYWNKIRKDFPEHFERMAKLERQLKYKINNKYLDEMGRTEGNFAGEQPITCDVFCESVASKLAG